jgi:hypothetical protein
MEEALNIWIKDTQRKNMPIERNKVHEKAKSPYSHFRKSTRGEGTNATLESNFSASEG